MANEIFIFKLPIAISSFPAIHYYSKFIFTKNIKMEQIIVRKASLKDLDTLFQFEQGVIAAERPFDSTLKSGHIHYYDLEEMITAPHIELVVAELENQLIGSGYARIENAKHYLQHA